MKLVTVALLMVITSPALAAIPFEFLDNWGGIAMAVESRGNYVFAAVGASIGSDDVSAPT